MLREHLPPILTMDTPDAVALLYTYVLDAISSGDMRVLPVLQRTLGSPYLVTEETFGTGATAEEGQAAMMELFPSSIPLE